MRLIDLKCPNCGAQLKIEEGMARAFCMHCGHQLIVDDERIRADSGSFRDAGYEFERGRIQAQAEQQAYRGNPTAPTNTDRTRERHLNSVHRWILILASFFIFSMGLFWMNRWLAIILSAGAIVASVADRRINLFVRILVIPGMMLILLLRTTLY